MDTKVIPPLSTDMNYHDVIYGIGTDIVRIERIKILFSRHGTSFVNKILNAAEKSLFDAINPTRQTAYLAKRFACKEAVVKALGVGIGYECQFHDISITNDNNGKPAAFLSTTTTERMLVKTVCHTFGKISSYVKPTFIIQISMSDEEIYAIAHAVAIVRRQQLENNSKLS